MPKVDLNTLILEKVIVDLNDNHVHMWNKSINWKVVNINKGIAEFGKLINASKQMKVKVSDEVVTIVIGGATMKYLQHINQY